MIGGHNAEGSWPIIYSADLRRLPATNLRMDLLEGLAAEYDRDDIESLHDIDQENLLACCANAMSFALAVQMMYGADAFFP